MEREDGAHGAGRWKMPSTETVVTIPRAGIAAMQAALSLSARRDARRRAFRKRLRSDGCTISCVLMRDLRTALRSIAHYDARLLSA